MMNIDNAHPVITEADNSGQSNPQSNSSSETVIEPMQKGRTTYAESALLCWFLGQGNHEHDQCGDHRAEWAGFQRNFQQIRWV